ncbi:MULTISPECIES: hypothetical protein [Pseudofrankia]|uniref:hypothetical protein n=1 Tax=Pseudofrankia TaxID=2994363 RepID=UPI000234B508|nr:MULTISPECIES: hypothetical protein [Pseudofrankia]OHV39588.1 hypothetical protein BCD49_11060 [Pseudofrankia sp. EUN1h]
MGALPLLVATALAGCGQDRDETLSSSAPEGATTTTADPGGTPTTPEPSPQPAPTTGGATSGGDTGSSGGAGGTGQATGGGEATGSGQASDGAGATPSGESGAPTAPNVSASPVFVGEPCAPSLDTAPAIAINGLLLYCAPPATGSNGLGSWSDAPPEQQQQGPTPGAECDSSDMGQVQQGPSGRPVACLREPNGEFRWADIS